jgi:hypothetical protein
MKPVIILVIVTLMGCSRGFESAQNHLSGHYKVTTIVANVEVDLNNDGIKSDNFFAEISKPFETTQGDFLPYYNFDFPGNYMEIRPLKGATNDAKLISVNFPDQHIGQLNDEEFYLSDFENSFTAYLYEIAESELKLTYYGDPNYIENGKINKLLVVEVGILKLELTKKVFDFSDSTWKEVEVTAFYSKVN